MATVGSAVTSGTTKISNAILTDIMNAGSVAKAAAEIKAQSIEQIIDNSINVSATEEYSSVAARQNIIANAYTQIQSAPVAAPSVNYLLLGSVVVVGILVLVAAIKYTKVL